jgi:hypothetical protein
MNTLLNNPFAIAAISSRHKVLNAWLVPLTSKHGKVLITDIRIDYSQKWLNNHWRTIESAYRNAPFFEHYADQVQKVLQKGHTFLYDLNMELLTICLKWLKSDISIEESITYEKIPCGGHY